MGKKMKRRELEPKKQTEQSGDDVLLDGAKRAHLKWTAPVVVGVMLPTHAQATTTAPPTCGAVPVMEATVPSKCATVAGSDEIAGQATVVVKSDSDPIEIISIDHNGGSEIQLPGLPATVTSASGAEIKWAGPATDGLTCLPITQITFTVTFTCNEAPNGSASFNLTELLAAVIP